MSPTPREVALSQIEPSGTAVERGVLSHGSHVNGRSKGTRLLEKPVENPDDKDFRGLDANFDLGLGKEPASLFDFTRSTEAGDEELSLFYIWFPALYGDVSA